MAWVKSKSCCKLSSREMEWMDHSTTERREGVLKGSCFFHSQYSAMSKYFFPVLHCSWNSERRAPMSRMAESSLGKIRITRSRLRTSSFSLSWEFVLLSLTRYFRGKDRIVRDSSNPSSRQSIDLEAFFSKVARISFLMARASSFVSARNKRPKASARGPRWEAGA